MKKYIFLGIFVSSVTGAYAENDNASTSKEYVDAAIADKQPTVPAAGANNVMTYDSSATNGIGTKGIYDATGDYASQQNALVTAATANAAVQMAINGEFVCHEWNPDNSNDCWLWKIKEPVAQSRNLFDISKVPNTFRNGYGIVNNGDGSLTVTRDPTSTAIASKKLSELAPNLVIGDTYILTFETTDAMHKIYLGLPAKVYWTKGTSRTITQDILDSIVFFYNVSFDTPATISNIQIEEGTVATPYQPYGQNTYLPQSGR